MARIDTCDHVSRKLLLKILLDYIFEFCFPPKKMSFCKYKSAVEIGDTVVIYLSPKQMYRIKVKENEIFQTRFGALKHNDVIGRKYGSKIDCTKGFVHILDLTPELWTLTLTHRTQILYGHDISFILMQLALKPGSSVLEAGTGSGSLSHCIARTISPNGRLMTFDFHQERVLTAREEFQDHGLDSIVTVQHRDVCIDGFAVEANAFDAVFLDLPHPWKAIPFADLALKNGGRICCFSPCIEQVQRTCQTLSNFNFMDIDTYEVVLRPYELRDLSLKNYKFSPNKEDQTEEPSNCVSVPEAKKVKLSSNANDSRPNEDYSNYSVFYMNNEVAGHTGFLTFATKYTEEKCLHHDIWVFNLWCRSIINHHRESRQFICLQKLL